MVSSPNVSTGRDRGRGRKGGQYRGDDQFYRFYTCKGNHEQHIELV